MNNYMDIGKLAGTEVNIVINWWSKNLESFPQKNIESFKQCLSGMIYGRICNHWYPDNPAKGSGYRAIINDYHIDPILKQACEISGIDTNFLASQCVLIISPGIVRIRSTISDKEEVIYSGVPII